MNELEKIRQEIEEIKKRNIKVEADKAWEVSMVRRVIIATLTYAVIVIFFLYVGFVNPFVNALIPTTGFVLSTLTIPIFKNIWLGKYYNKKISSKSGL